MTNMIKKKSRSLRVNVTAAFQKLREKGPPRLPLNKIKKVGNRHHFFYFKLTTAYTLYILSLKQKTVNIFIKYSDRRHLHCPTSHIWPTTINLRGHKTIPLAANAAVDDEEADAEELLTTRIAQITAEMKDTLKVANPETPAVEVAEEDEAVVATSATTHLEPQPLEVVDNHPVKALMDQAPPVTTRLEMP